MVGEKDMVREITSYIPEMSAVAGGPSFVLAKTLWGVQSGTRPLNHLTSHSWKKVGTWELGSKSVFGPN